MYKFIFLVLTLGAFGWVCLVPHQPGRAAAAKPPAPPVAVKPRYDQLVITGSNSIKNEWGGVEGVLRLENIGDRDIKDIVVIYTAVAPSGTVLATRRATIYRSVAAHSTEVLSAKPMVPPQTESVRFQIESYTLQ